MFLPKPRKLNFAGVKMNCAKYKQRSYTKHQTCRVLKRGKVLDYGMFEVKN